MLAAVDGEILVQTTKASSRSRELTVGATQKLEGAFNSPTVTSGLKLGRASSAEETRKSVAQSAFARFRQNNAATFVLRTPVGARGHAREYRSERRRARALRRNRTGVRVAELRRGDLIELEATLSAADIFQVRTAINAVGDVVDSFPDFLPLEQRELIRQVRPLTALIDTLNADAIPVDVVLPNLTLERLDNEDWLIAVPGFANKNLRLHTATMPEWYWGDVGRTLFQSRRFTLLCRVVDPRLVTGPAQSYVGAILSAVSPQLAATVDGFGPTMLGALRQGTALSNHPVEDNDWVSTYVTGLGNILGVDTPTTPSLDPLRATDLRSLPMGEQIELFAAIDVALGVDTGSHLNELETLRNLVRDEHHLWPWSVQIGPPVEVGADEAGVRFEVELVAAYW